MKILVFANYYVPGFRAGGPIRSLLGLVNQLGNEIEFSIVTRDRDYGDSAPYDGIRRGIWTQVGDARVCYVSRPQWPDIYRLLQADHWDILYLQSFFNRDYSVKPLSWYRRGRLPVDEVLIAPRGEFSAGALSIKSRKKSLYISLSGLFRLYRGVFWHASSEYERADISRAIPRIADAHRIFVAPNLPYISNLSSQGNASTDRRDHRLRVLFISRITAMKNLDFAIRILAGVKSPVEFNIYGALDGDLRYWSKCLKGLAELPSHIEATYHGDVPHEHVRKLFTEHDVLLLPTKGENFGHVILESLDAGCRVLISDRTPWRDLEASGAGWAFSLESPHPYQEVIESMANSPLSERHAQRAQCLKYANAYIFNGENTSLSRRMFETVVCAYTQKNQSDGIASLT